MRKLIILGSCCLWCWAAPVGAHDEPSALISHCTEHIQARPGDGNLYLQRGELYRAAGQWAAAEADYRTAAGLGSEPARVALCQAALALDRGHPEAALELLTTDDSEACLLRGRALRELGRPREAADSLGQALAGNPRPRPEDYLELSAVVAGQSVTEALDVVDEGIQRLGPAVSLVLAAVEFEVGLGRFDAALARLDAAPLWRDSADGLTRRGGILLLAGRELEAQVSFTAALDRLASLPPERRAAPANAALATVLHAHLSSGVTP